MHSKHHRTQRAWHKDMELMTTGMEARRGCEWVRTESNEVIDNPRSRMMT